MALIPLLTALRQRLTHRGAPVPMCRAGLIASPGSQVRWRDLLRTPIDGRPPSRRTIAMAGVVLLLVVGAGSAQAQKARFVAGCGGDLGWVGWTQLPDISIDDARTSIGQVLATSSVESFSGPKDIGPNETASYRGHYSCPSGSSPYSFDPIRGDGVFPLRGLPGLGVRFIVSMNNGANSWEWNMGIPDTPRWGASGRVTGHWTNRAELVKIGTIAPGSYPNGRTNFTLVVGRAMPNPYPGDGTGPNDGLAYMGTTLGRIQVTRTTTCTLRDSVVSLAAATLDELGNPGDTSTWSPIAAGLDCSATSGRDIRIRLVDAQNNGNTSDQLQKTGAGKGVRLQVTRESLSNPFQLGGNWIQPIDASQTTVPLKVRYIRVNEPWTPGPLTSHLLVELNHL